MKETEHYDASPSPLPPVAGATGGADEGEEGGGADSRFLLRAASLAFRLCPEGMELRRVGLSRRHFTFGVPDCPEDRLPCCAVGPVPDDDGNP